MRLAAFLLAAATLGADDPARDLNRPFLDVFFDGAGAKPVTEQVWTNGLRGFAAHPVPQNGQEHFPAVLILSESEAVARDFGEAGFAALAVDLETAGISPLVDAVRGSGDRLDAGIEWLRHQPYVDAARIGVVGWGGVAQAARELAGRGSVRAAVVTGEDCADSTLGSARLLVIGEACGARFPDASDQTWVAIYEFLGKHLEDAPPVATHIARIVDIMRVINSDDGVKGRLSRALASPPDEAQWDEARSEAAILAESGNLLAGLPSPKGDAEGWRRQAEQFRDAAAAIVRAIEGRNLAAAQNALRILPRSCANCHRIYR